MTIRVVCYGLGPIGIGIARLALTRAGVEVVGAIDLDPQKIGRDLGTLVGVADAGVIVSGDAAATLAEARPDVVLHATSSALAKVAEQLGQIAKAGAHVVSTCEELAYPWTAQPQLAAELDAAARRAGVTLLGTGVNPGYAMDALPLMLTAPCAAVRGVRVLRVVDAARRRGPLQRKVGAGLTPAEFEARVKTGLVRHVGLPESLHMLATRLGWRLDKMDDTIAAVLAESRAANVRRRARSARLSRNRRRPTGAHDDRGGIARRYRHRGDRAQRRSKRHARRARVGQHGRGAAGSLLVKVVSCQSSQLTTDN